ncbi:alpha-glucuronidase family glycosyl hydrolase [Saccharibacillus sacchari]|uniref:alpha-glucuronidase family glycosyl hydrolase n=1 Tax=Saccharibacillus sacchari TaxID=456493 RepID=UPI0004BC80EF|nr:alpha-glucuronidase family glycosyl hydrolase [Saccharibacillus sacchari]
MTSLSRGRAAWLPAERWQDPERIEHWRPLFERIDARMELRPEGPGASALQELVGGIKTLTGLSPSLALKAGAPVLILGSPEAAQQSFDEWNTRPLPEEAYALRIKMADEEASGQNSMYAVLRGGSERGLLYGVFALLRLIGTEPQGPYELDVVETPGNPLRMIDQWDNMDGSVERGYSGNSIFYRENRILPESKRIADYARLLASVGINAISVNNVNVHREETKLITSSLLPDVKRLSDVFGRYGIRMFLSVNYAAPIELGELDTADPLNEDVKRWWQRKAEEIYAAVPELGGFVVKADSENRPGPFTYGRDHADGANLLADALAPFGGTVLWRCFVYDCHQDWRDRSTDRARAAYDHFRELDGRFRDNVVLQIKNGPMDFQVREPVSPLFGAMPQTNQMMEFQIAQEYTGQQKDVCFLVPQWKKSLDFDTLLNGAGSTVAKIAAGKVYPFTRSGVAAVSNIGDDDNWTGHHLAQANLFGFGRLAWNPELESETIAEEWSALTFGANTSAANFVKELLLESWPVYESYTAPLGVGWMVQPHYHYAVDVDGYEYSKWGTYHFADRDGIGVDRTIATGTGYTGQYADENRDLYDSLDECPDELLLFFHHVPYTHVLKSGKTVIQHIYDSRFEGTEKVERWIARWRELENEVDPERFLHILRRLEGQSENAKQWRDAVNTYFYRKSGIPDERERTLYA